MSDGTGRVVRNDNDLHGDTDATHWAERFVLVRRNLFTGPEHKDIAEDPDTMLAWFAAAIETGRMAGARTGRHRWWWFR